MSGQMSSAQEGLTTNESGLRGSNPSPKAWEAFALPNELRPQEPHCPLTDFESGSERAEHGADQGSRTPLRLSSRLLGRQVPNRSARSAKMAVNCPLFEGSSELALRLLTVPVHGPRFPARRSLERAWWIRTTLSAFVADRGIDPLLMR